MGCWDIFCFICGCPARGIDKYFYDNLLDEEKEDIDIKNKIKKLKQITKWMSKCSMLLSNNKVIHGVQEVDCNINFRKNNNDYTHQKLSYELPDFPYGIFIHTDCWKFVKNEYDIELKLSDLPILFPTKNLNKVFDFVNYGEIENFWGQDFQFLNIINLKKNYLMSSPLLKNKNITQIKRNFNSLKIKSNRLSPLSSATLYKTNDIKIGNDNYFWIIKNGKWNRINEKPIKIYTTIQQFKKYTTKIFPFGLSNNIPIFIYDVEYKNDKITLLTIKSFMDSGKVKFK